MWRWSALLPVQDPAHIVTLGEGGTPMLHLPRIGSQLGLPRLYVKDESFNPTGSFKARGLSAAVSMTLELGVERLIIPTAGNAGGAMASYAARAGLPACVYLPQDTPRANVEECRIAGAEVVLVPGLISDSAWSVGQRAAAEGWFDLSTFKEPYRLEGKKVMGYEIAEAFNWQLPDVVIYPTGGGTGLVGIWKAITELYELGWLETSSRPRLVAVQAQGCAPVVRAFDLGAETCDFWEDAHTAASGLRVPKPYADRLILRALRESGGMALCVSEDAIRAAQVHLASQEGLFAAPEGAATLAGLESLLARGWVDRQERILLLNTGTGLKYL
jgi:threonine synthase